MFDFKTIITSALTAIVVVVLSGLVGGTSSDSELGAAYRLPNSDVTAKSLASYNPSATSTMYSYSGAANVGGSVILEDTDAAGCTAISALNGTVSGVTVTCP